MLENERLLYHVGQSFLPKQLTKQCFNALLIKITKIHKTFRQ
ncbi:hypothetical protein M23134_00881 [Microscilla marina ATCC 23134]|uniref:Uncharacterized protein n=1 Tax=Microscilla marina ATCC 23134 TaxID=313606 RepID=A1ZUP1_MICM2|nr:hypothetical protein M23134_00881 [Microscilla marina ATCC 23134]